MARVTRTSLVLTPRQLFDLELLLDGAFAPLVTFLGEQDYRSVIADMRLVDGRLWPMPIVLDLPESELPVPGTILSLCDTSGREIARMRAEEAYRAQTQEEALAVYGTLDMAHPGVRYLLNETHPIYVTGPLTRIAHMPKPDFAELRRSPAEVRDEIAARGWGRVVAFQTRNPIHRAHYEILTRAARTIDGHILLHPVVGITKDGDIDYPARTRSYIRLQERYLREHALLSLLPLAMRMAGPREALWHALIRKNYGATHFVVGRDHAGPGPDSAGRPFYPTYAAQELAVQCQWELGITIIPTSEMLYVENEDRYVPADELLPHHRVCSISGTQFRRLLRDGEMIPPWFSFPEVIEELRSSFDALQVPQERADRVI